MMFCSAKKLIIASFTLLLLGFASCQKEKGKEDPEPTRKELLSYAWKVVDVRQGSESGVSVIGLPFDEVQCLKDNILTFVNDDSFSFSEGANVCDPAMEAAGTWSLIDSDTKLKLSSPGEDDIIINIVSITATTFKFQYEITDGIAAGIYVVIMEHQ